MALFLGVAMAAGCNSAPGTSKPIVRQKPPEQALADTVAESLQRSNDLAASRRLVEQLNVALGRADAASRVPPVSAEAKAALAKDVGLAAPEIEEVARTEFTPLDGYALEEAFLFRDLARSLDVSAVPAEARIRAASDWVARNIRGVESPVPAAPPVFTLMRGQGTGLEKTYVLMNLLRQLDLDVALLGDASGEPAKIWGVAVRTDDGVVVLDARLGLPLTGPDGRLATLKQLRADPGILQSFGGAQGSYDITPERIQNSALFVTAPLSSLAPRMKLLQGLLPQGSAQVSTDVAALLDRFQKAADGVPVKAWASPAPDALPRVLMTFLPVQDGGSDRAELGQQRFVHYQRELVPWQVVPPFLMSLTGEPGDRTKRSFAARVLTLKQPGQARDLMIRGQFQEATEKLVALVEELERSTLSERELEENSRGWSDAARGVYADLLRAERAAKTDPAAAAQIPDIREKIDNLWKKSIGPKMYLDLLATPTLNEEATYLRALSKHEQSARSGQRQDAAGLETARKWWVQYLNQFATSPSAGAARRNLALVFAAEGNRAAAAAEFANAANAPSLTPLERLACQIQAKQLQP